MPGNETMGVQAECGCLAACLSTGIGSVSGVAHVFYRLCVYLWYLCCQQFGYIRP